MAFLKHVGRLTTNNRKVVVAYRVLPGDPEHCLVVTTENLNADEHDSLMKLVESNAGQTAEDLADAMNRTRLADGRVMLPAFHTTGRLSRVPTSIVEMTPTNIDRIKLDELNRIVAEQKGVSVADLAVKESNKAKQEPTQPLETVEEVTTVQEEVVLSDEDLAAQYRSQADAMFKEAKRLREQAEELSPTKKKTSKKSTESA